MENSYEKDKKYNSKQAPKPRKGRPRQCLTKIQWKGTTELPRSNQQREDNSNYHPRNKQKSYMPSKPQLSVLLNKELKFISTTLANHNDLKKWFL